MEPDVIPAAQMKNIVPGTTDQFWSTKRHFGGGPTYIKLGRKVFYRLADVEAWLNENRYTRTDKPVERSGGRA
jgi:hypothetical protein